MERDAEAQPLVDVVPAPIRITRDPGPCDRAEPPPGAGVLEHLRDEPAGDEIAGRPVPGLRQDRKARRLEPRHESLEALASKSARGVGAQTDGADVILPLRPRDRPRREREDGKRVTLVRGQGTRG